MTMLNTHHWARETEQILAMARQALSESRSPDIRDLVQRLPINVQADERPISLVFAGQYSSGKSTLLKALTGRDDIATGAGITTEEAHSYEWEGVTVIDTPGIHTSLRPDHDATSYEAISNADLMVFVITNELFDSHLGHHYRKLTIDHEKAYETILVVNKMGRHANGNTPETQSIITEDLRKPLEPFTPEDLRITFTDAKSALEAQTETDPEFADDLAQEGNLDGLVANLNELISQQCLLARHTTVLYSIDQVLQEAIELEPTDDPEADSMVLVYNQNIRAITEARDQVRLVVRNAIAKATTEISICGSELTEHIYPEVTQDQLECAAERAQSRLEEIHRQLIQETEDQASEILPMLNNRLEDLEGSSRYQETFRNIHRRMEGHDWSGAFHRVTSVAKTLSDLSQKLAFNSAKVSQGASGVARFSGSIGHQAILGIGHRLGHSFRPWEAVRLTSYIGRAAPFLTIAGAALTVGAQLHAERREDKKSQELQKIRQDIRAEFATISASTESTFNGAWAEVIKEMLDDPLEQLIQHREELNAHRQEQNQHLQRLNEASTAANALIHRIHTT